MRISTMPQMKEFFINKFDYLTDSEAEILAQHGKWISFETSQNLLEYDKYERAFYCIIEGHVRGFKYVDEWEEYTIFLAGPEQCILSPEKLLRKDKTPNEVTFQALNNCKTISFDHNELLQIASENPGILEFYLDSLNQIANSLYERIQLLLIENAEERYRYLAETRPEIVKLAQKKHLAQFLGITPNSLSRILRNLKTK